MRVPSAVAMPVPDEALARAPGISERVLARADGRLDNSCLGNYMSSMTSRVSQKRAASELTEHTGFWMRRVSNYVSSSFAGRLADLDVTVAEWVVLRQMYGHEDTTSPGAV